MYDAMGREQPAGRVALRVWLAVRDRNQRWLSRELGIDESLLSRYLRGDRTAPSSVVERIEQLTGVQLYEQTGVA